MKTSNPYEDTAVRQLLGDTLRPGGFKITAEALELAAFPAGARLLDLGCGPGATLGLLRERGFEAVGVDSSPALLTEAEKKSTVIEADFRRVPLASDWADGVFCECSLSLAEDKEEVLRECARLLKPGGRLVISDLFRQNDSSALGRFSRSPADCAAGAMSLPELSGWLHWAGFSLLERRDYSPALKELAARLVWELGSAEALTGLWPVCDGGTVIHFSYCLIIAVKGSDSGQEQSTHKSGD